MSNAGLERDLQTFDLKLARAQVGDRYVIEKMNRAASMSAANNPAISCSTISATTGDGLIAAFRCSRCWREEGKPASEAAHIFEPLPQILENVRFGTVRRSATERGRTHEGLRTSSWLRAVILVRKSGTEPVIRVMAEGEDESSCARS